MRIGFYGSTRAYWPVLEQHDMLDLGEKLNHMSKTNQWGKMTGEISDDLVHLFAAVGRHDEIANAIAKRFGGLSDSISDSAAVCLQKSSRIFSAFHQNSRITLTNQLRLLPNQDGPRVCDHYRVHICGPDC